MALPTNLPTELLRTFITINDLGSYTAAGNLLGRTQPAVSLQMRRLEDLVQEKLFLFDGRVITLTEAGSTLSGYARQILHLNDVAVSNFLHTGRTGVLRIGLPIDFAVSVLQETITDFMDDNPEVELEMRCDLSPNLINDLHGDQIDFAVALIAGERDQYLVRAWEEHPIWVTAEDSVIDPEVKIPLISHPEGCEYRLRMINALKAAGKDWRIAYTSPNVTGLQDAVMNGLGVSALTRSTLQSGMRILDEADGFPPLEKIRIGIFYKHPRLSNAGLSLSNYVIAKLDEATDEHFGPVPQS